MIQITRGCFIGRYQKLVLDNEDRLHRARKRGEATNKAQLDMTLGEGKRTEFLAHCGLSSMEDAVNQCRVVYKSKRKAMLSIGDIFLIAGKYGVIVYDLPMENAIGSFGHSQHSILDSKPFLEKIGAVVDGRSKQDDLINYSDCVIEPDPFVELAA